MNEQYRALKYCPSVLAVSPVLPAENILRTELLSAAAVMIWLTMLVVNSTNKKIIYPRKCKGTPSSKSNEPCFVLYKKNCGCCLRCSTVHVSQWGSAERIEENISRIAQCSSGSDGTIFTIYYPILVHSKKKSYFTRENKGNKGTPEYIIRIEW